MDSLNKIIFFLAVGLLGAGCHSDTLSIQTEFPFTLSTSVLPTAVRAGEPTEFSLHIVPARVTTDSRYSLSWRKLTLDPASLTLASVNLPENKVVAVDTLAPTIRFISSKVGQHSFLLQVTDQNGAIQQLTLSLNAQ